MVRKIPPNSSWLWVPIIHQFRPGNIFNWTHILSANIKNKCKSLNNLLQDTVDYFFMSSYLVDSICAVTPFPLLPWSWSPSEEPIHLYYCKIWAINCKNHFYDICNFFMIPLHLILKNLLALRFSEEAINSIKK